ncbi:enolase C-terminal domain-like protein [Azospira restricta]|uniref:O-succinylbenzoate synthase n=1 Tax=Azospira restricta TaxID=404405 RepID=A0A974SN56_9RHOO|nr:enolase C-terminal domain-like protein [Azospira restricta]QRJ62348.1 o-succinylbenzoate synthase [Azospira restricta]
MRIVAATPFPYALPLAARWPGATLPGAVRAGWLLRIDADDGRRGWGECAPLPAHGGESPAAAADALRQWCARLPGQRVDEALAAPDAFAAPAARAAVDSALLDLAAQAVELPLWRHLNAAAGGGTVAVNAMAGDALAGAPARIAAALAAGFTVIKLKVGVGDAGRELAALRELAAALPPHARLRLDANRAWDAATAAHVCAALAELPVESLEEPLAAPTPAALAALQRELPFALAIDESWRELDHEEFFAAPPVRRLVLKLAAHSGLRPALATARRARAAGIDCVVTTGVDSACGTLAAAHLAAAIGNGLAHGLATSDWLAADTGTPPAIGNGRLQLPEVPGLGFVPQHG